MDDDVRQLARLFGANLRRLRDAAGMTQAELCDAAEVAPRTLRGIERAHYTPSFKLMARLARALEAEPLDFFQPTEFEERPPGRPKKS